MINKIKNLINLNNLDGYIVPKNDEFFTEYSKINKLEIVANFSGSAGFILILKNSNHLFVDGRYTIQAKKQSGKKFKIHEIPYEWPKDILKKDARLNIGFDPKLFTTDTLKRYFNNSCNLFPVESNLFRTKAEIVNKDNLIYHINTSVVGESSKSKINRLNKIVESEKLDNLFISSGENVCWLLNIRGKDLPNSPIANFQAILTSNKNIILFGNIKKLKNIKKEFLKNKISFYEKENFFKILSSLKGKSFCIDSKTCSVFNEKLINSRFLIRKRVDPIYDLKSIKNKIEIKNMIEAHIKDGVAVTKFLFWIKNSNVKKLDEIKVEKKLESFRKKSKNYLFPSFSTIAGSGPNGAIIHYRSNIKSNRKLNKDHLLLVDSGGQYKWGTTDITRTISFSDPSKKTKELYTRVLKGHIAVAISKIDKLKNGNNIDKLARKSINSINLDYRHGTGHGVGFFMNVHEGPQSIAKNNFIKLKKGMIVSNEPGIYLENKFGIRIENLVYIDGNNKNLCFKNLTFAPLEKDLIDENMLTKIEKDYIFSYHLETYSKLSAYLNNKERKWLAKLIE
ncbi:aminopeptidase P family protein [Candidatus Pelagibacter sp. RS40]|uniref:aminopeptidase P family protein n=1 Tax=Candidatus Pelagibacter sp. RS40 TaxID=1977865 RepID=UPI000A1669E9|nr:aminopeptidase P family protein [Candidatus Pelagibacter sp. RS40]ARJ48770.1 Xaa-Pro aminopeptidase [Candidatus Pelagibacter sp. RS40]